MAVSLLNEPSEIPSYRLDEQVGFVLRQVEPTARDAVRRAHRRHTPMQWAALSKLHEIGVTSRICWVG